jgi:L-asparaginase
MTSMAADGTRSATTSPRLTRFAALSIAAAVVTIVLVVVALGAGHLPPPLFDELAAMAEAIPVVATCRPERGAILHETYGFEGAERDLRSGRLVIAGELSPQAARMRLLAQLGAGVTPS